MVGHVWANHRSKSNIDDWHRTLMDRSNEGAPTPPPHTPAPPVSAQPLQITPDNVVELAVMFHSASDSLLIELTNARDIMGLREPWMDDAASRWMWQFFRTYFLDGDTSFLGVLQDIHKQHEDHAQALRVAAAQYGKTDELNAALLHSRMPR